jgi:hypothetical protein
MLSIPRPLVRTNQSFIFVTVVLSLLLQQPYLLFLPLLVGLYSLFFRQNPIFLLDCPLLTKPPAAYVQEDATQQRFNQWIAVSCIALSFTSFLADLPAMGYLFAILVAAASLIAIFGFCIGCFIHFQYNQWKHRRKINQ